MTEWVVVSFGKTCSNDSCIFHTKEQAQKELQSILNNAKKYSYLGFDYTLTDNALEINYPQGIMEIYKIYRSEV